MLMAKRWSHHLAGDIMNTAQRAATAPMLCRIERGEAQFMNPGDRIGTVLLLGGLGLIVLVALVDLVSCREAGVSVAQ